MDVTGARTDEVVVEIGELVLEGFDGVDRGALEHALESELVRVFRPDAEGPTLPSRSVRELRTHTRRVPPEGGAEALAGEVARALRRELGR